MLLHFAFTSASAAPYEQEDFETRVSGASECLIMQRSGATEPAMIIVWLRSMSDFVTIDPLDSSTTGQALKLVEDFLHSA